MNLISVKFIEESTEAAFFYVTVEIHYCFAKSKTFTRKALLRKHNLPGLLFHSFPEWADTGTSFLESHITSAMIFQYERFNDSTFKENIIEAYNDGILAGESAGINNYNAEEYYNLHFRN